MVNQSLMGEKIYLPGLNGFLAIASLAVIFSHISLGMDKFGFAKTSWIRSANFE